MLDLQYYCTLQLSSSNNHAKNDNKTANMRSNSKAQRNNNYNSSNTSKNNNNQQRGQQTNKTYKDNKKPLPHNNSSPKTADRQVPNRSMTLRHEQWSNKAGIIVVRPARYWELVWCFDRLRKTECQEAIWVDLKM